MRSAAVVAVKLLGVILVGLTACTGEGLRERIESAGVFSPGRSDVSSARIADLGQLLFFDRELSGNRNVACASCHMPFHHAGDQQELGRGQGATGTGVGRVGGIVLPRNTPSPFNRSFAHSLFWDGRVESLDDGTFRAPVTLPEGIRTILEAQAVLPMLDRDEMRGHTGEMDILGGANELAPLADDDPDAIWAAVMVRLMAIDEYRTLFAEVFPTVPAGEHTIVHVARAIARFEMRLWELTDTPFDQFLGAEHREPNEDALDELSRRGAELFFGDAGCDRCHDGPLLSDFAFHNIGVPPLGPGKRDGMDEGRYLVTGDVADRFAFRTPPLRNVALTAPYMHDGAIGTLAEAIRHHVDPERALSTSDTDAALADEIRATIDPDVRPLRTLSDDDLFYLEQFLNSLSSRTESAIFVGAGEPLTVPSGLTVEHAEL